MVYFGLISGTYAESAEMILPVHSRHRTKATLPECMADMVDEYAIDRWQRAAALAGDIRRDPIQELCDLLEDRHPFVRWEAGVALANTATRLQTRARLGLSIWNRRWRESTFAELLDLMRTSLQSPIPQRRAATADALGLWDHEGAVALLIPALEDSESLVRAGAATALGRIGDKAAVSALAFALKDSSVWVRRAAADALGAIGAPEAVPALQLALSDAQPLVLNSVICALGHLPTTKARRLLVQHARGDDPVVRWYVARSLATIGDASSLPALEHLQGDDTELFGQPISDITESAIKRIKKRESGPWNQVRKTFYALRYRLEGYLHKKH